MNGVKLNFTHRKMQFLYYISVQDQGSLEKVKPIQLETVKVQGYQFKYTSKTLFYLNTKQDNLNFF